MSDRHSSTKQVFDLAIIGGGINGCGIARDAAGRGYSVFLTEKNDLAQGTSSGSTKLIHGGLRYLEHYEFRLVRESLQEREVLWAMAPHIIWPLRFVLPHASGLRPAWLLRLGLFLYDHIGGRKRLPPASMLDLGNHPAGKPLKPGFKTAFEYSDCWVDDARLVILNAIDAARHGAMIKTRSETVRLCREGEYWRIVNRDHRTGRDTEVHARMVINAAGPWVDAVIGHVAGQRDARNVRHVQGSHIVVKKLFDHHWCYIFQNPDGRIFFAIPYEQDFTLIGTTDHDFKGDLDQVSISDDEIEYICEAASDYFAKPVVRDEVVWTYSAVRPLYDDGISKAQEATRDYVLRVDGEEHEAKLLNIFGGKITTYRRLAEAVMTNVDDMLGRETQSWTSGCQLPGGEFGCNDFEPLVAALHRDFSFLDSNTVRRLVRCYGTIAREVLADASSWDDLGETFATGLTEREVEYLRSREWAETADDILWRRTKLGLRFSDVDRNALEDWLTRHPVKAHAA